MNSNSAPTLQACTEQRAIHSRCFHPAGDFTEFARSEIDQPIAARFEKIARRYPDRPAILATDRSWTYGELDARTSAIAVALRERLGSESEPIALLTDNGSDTIAAILAVLKAGKFFTLLDPYAPAKRNALMADDAQTRLIIGNQSTLTAAASLVHPSRSAVDLAALGNSDAPIIKLEYPSADKFGYLLYTSGTTGRPKGVAQSQRNILHGAMRRINGFHISPSDRLTLLSGSTHQAVMNILSALLAGAAICPFNARLATAAQFTAWLESLEITIYHSSASLLRQLIQTSHGRAELSAIRLVRSASESPTVADVEQCRSFFPPDCIFANGLGATETGTATLYFIDRDTPLTAPTVPIGYPLDDMEILLLDGDGQPGRNGVGEIAIRSRYLAPGYWRRPELNQEKFRADPDGGDRRIYLSGDMGRFTAAGALEHLGRKDFQVKIRGHRVETMDVEHQLLTHPAIAQAYVMGGELPSGETRLIGYLVGRGDQRLSTGTLRDYLRSRLSDPMIPAVFIYVDSLPLNPAGKVDRQALPKPQHMRPDLDYPYVAPRTEVERKLAELWAQTLQLDQVGMHDRFFDLGGHSLAATRLLSRVIQEFKVEVPISTLFKAPTVADMAAVIEAGAMTAPGDTRLAQLLSELESMTEADAAARLAAIAADKS